MCKGLHLLAVQGVANNIEQLGQVAVHARMRPPDYSKPLNGNGPYTAAVIGAQPPQQEAEPPRPQMERARTRTAQHPLSFLTQSDENYRHEHGALP